MKRNNLILLTILVFVGISVNAQKVVFPNKDFHFEINESINKYNVSFKIDEVNFSDLNSNNGSFTKLNIPGFFNHIQPGFPQLIQFNKFLETPLNGDFEVKITSKKYKLINLDSIGLPIIYPNQRSISKGEDASKVKFEISSKIYNDNKFINYDLVKLSKKGIFRKHQFSLLEICPFEYNPVSNQLIVYYDLEFEISFINGDLSKEHQLNKSYNQYEFLPVLKNCINNNSFQPKDLITTYPTTYVIVSDRKFQQQIQPFIEWKTKKGFNVIEAYTDEPLVGNTTSSIKAYLTNLYNNPVNSNPPSYILLVGDVAEIPSFSGLYGNHVSDMYYAEYDGNGDIYADVYYGRFSSSDTTQIQNMVNKSINYEKYNFQDPSFLSEAVMISGVDAAMAPTYGNGQINYANQYYTNLSNGINSHTYLYPASGSSSSQILQDINNGCSFANYTAHGYGQGWADPAFTCTDVHSMTNFGKPAMMIGNCCQSNKFDDPECFGEALLRVDNKGAIGYIGGSNNTYWNEDYWWAVGAGNIEINPIYNVNNLGFFDRLFHSNGEPISDWYTTNAQIMMGGNLAVTQAGGADAYYCEIYHLMGDPSIMTYFGIPSPLFVQHDPVIPIGMPSVDVVAEEGAYVALSQNGIYIDAGLVSNIGTINLDISSIASMDSIEVVVTKQNKEPYFGVIQIMNANGIFLSNSDNNFVDVIGNSNGLVDFNETIDVDVTIKNFGNVDANGVYAKLASTSSNVNILIDSSYWGAVSSGLSIQNLAAYRFSIDGFVEDQQIIPFQLEIMDDQSNIWNANFQITVNAPNANPISVVVKDSLFGNFNNRLDPGESLQLSLPTINTGHADNIQLTGNLSCNSNDIQFVNTSFNLGSLAVGQQLESVFDLIIDSNIVPGSIVTFTYELLDSGYANQYEFDLVVGLVVEDFNNGTITTNGWTNNSNFIWIMDSLVFFNDNYSYRSSNNADQTSSILQLDLDVAQESDLSFMKKVSSESGYDFLRFFIDSNEVDSWSGEDDWSLATYLISQGSHHFEWVYEKDFSVSDGLDAGWIDEVTFPITNGPNLSVSERWNDVILIYPNPAFNFINIDLGGFLCSNIEIFDIYGRLIKDNFNIGNNNGIISFPINNLKSGAYFVRISSKKESISKKIIIKK